MKRNIYLRILAGAITFVLLVLYLELAIVEPWIRRKIETKFSEKIKDYNIEVEKVRISVFKSAIELDSIKIYSKQTLEEKPGLEGKIAFIKLKGINLLKLLFRNDIGIREVVISNTNMNGKLPFQKKAKEPTISTLNIRIDSLRIDTMDMAIGNTLNSQAYSVKKGFLKIYDFEIKKLDTLTPALLKHFDFEAVELLSVSADSMHTFTASGVSYSDSKNTLLADSFTIHPNYSDYEFTARHKYQSDRIEARLSNINLHDFSAAGYLSSKKLASSYVEIGKLEVIAFRDKRKKFHHVNKPVFQDMIYDYPGAINIDSIALLNGNITYTEHAEKANEPGTITFNELNAKIYKITNDNVYKTEKGYLKMNAEGRLMGKSRMTVSLKGRLFDRNNTFSLNGSLSAMEVKALNPMLEKNAFIYATSGKIDKMHFSFTADNTKASGKMILLYHGLVVAVKNKRTDDTTAIKERVTSIIANIKVIDSNPVPKEAVREGIIDNARDPERFLLNYCAKSILSGIKSTLVKAPKK